jgi:phospholipase C
MLVRATFITLIICVVVCGKFVAEASPTTLPSLGDKIKHVIVLMLENRSFDHMLGFLKKTNNEVNGCLPDVAGCSNPYHPEDPNSAQVTVDDSAVYQQVSPHHSIGSTTYQVYGTNTPSGEWPTATMNGFVANYRDNFEDKSDAGAASVMKCFSPEHVPIITTLAQEFGFFDGWHASVPGPTMVNRAYAGSATSNGMGVNDEVTIAKGMPQKTVFRQLVEMGHDYRVYFQDAPTVLMFKDMRHKEARGKFKPMKQFKVDAAAGDLPAFVWLEPAYFNTPNQPASDQHPDHDVSLGEKLIKDTYEAIRNSPLWNETALVITYDEHGGFFDHVAPPQVNVPNPDGKNSTDDPFDFTRLGVRIPTVIASPWIPKGSLFHGPSDNESGQYDHTSTIATVVHKLFKPVGLRPNPEFLTKRDAWAKTFEWVFNLKQPRADCPAELPSILSHKEAFPDSLPVIDGSLPLSDLQMEIVSIISGLIPDASQTLDLTNWTEKMAFDYCESKLNTFLSSSNTSE